ncbi:MAG: DUF1553 domain-containing protein [Bryobacterales bacterium]|nr:DUF1553 domain-containing protein [Bryobacterales bacterium]
MRLLVFLLAGGLTAPAAPNAAKVDFNRQIRPLLSDSCFACHGPDEKRRMAGLRLDEKDSALKAVTPGNRAASKLFQRISHAEASRRMPPKSFDRPLTAAQIELVGRWIDEGAEWQTHWSYAPPKRSVVPEVAAGWARNEIDRFVQARLEKEGLKPSPEADRATLLRRLTLDLTGLPPTASEVQSFVGDKSPDAYEKAVDRLLRSPHYGEKMAMPWLDVARYADTHGYHIDSHRDMWPWRDWVIQSFNQNMRFDQFALWQLAGDLLPNPTREQRLATGFNRNHMINYEGGAIAEEYLTEYIVDRVETTSVAFMGMTMGCARCHDHKYDPISQRDFYRFFAFFNNVDEKGLDGREGNAKPMLPLPEPSQETRLTELRAAIAAREALLPEKEVEAAVAQWAATASPSVGPSGALAHYEMDGTFSDIAGGYRHARVVTGNPTFSGGIAGQSLNFDGETQVDWFEGGSLQQPLTVSFWLRLGNKLEQAVLRRSDGQRSFLVRTEEAVSIGDLKRGARLVVAVNGKTLRTRRYVVQGEFTQIGILSDGPALQIYLNGKPTEVDELQTASQATAAGPVPWTTGAKSFGMPFRSQLDELRLYQRALTAAELSELASEAVVRAILHTPAGKRTKDQKDRLQDFYLTHAAPEGQRKAYAELLELRKSEQMLDKTVVTAMVMTELPKMRDTYILGRGDYRNKTEKVTPAVPASLPPLPPGLPANRLGLAKWLIDPSHPLTARVTVNRFWQNLFGAGLVETSEDFGSQGAPPTHPELLDWLAASFVESGWDVKALQKKIVMSATYRQSAKATPELTERDPQNRLLARMSRFRLPAEIVRDNALAVSGLLNREIGGRSVYPYQPPGLWEELAYGDVFSAQTYVPSTGKDLYRRSMYTFWKRTVPPAQMATFDAPDREKCIARRARTNTPLQALILMNDPTYLEAARKLAERVLSEGGKDAAARIRTAFQLAAARAPQPAETKLLTQLAQTQSAAYKKDPALAAKLLAIGESKPNPALAPAELAAWTTVTSAILNLDEVITKE